MCRLRLPEISGIAVLQRTGRQNRKQINQLKETKEMNRPCYRMAESKNSKINLRRNYYTKLKRTITNKKRCFKYLFLRLFFFLIQFLSQFPEASFHFLYRRKSGSFLPLSFPWLRFGSYSGKDSSGVFWEEKGLAVVCFY